MPYIRLAILSLLLLGVMPVYGQMHKWKMATSWAGGPLLELGAKAFADKIEFLSEGRIQVQVFPAGVLGKPLNVSDTVKMGVAQCGHTWIGYDWGKDQTAVLFGGYAGSFGSEMMLHWLYEAGGQQLWAQWRQEKFNVVSRPLYLRPAEVFLHSHKKVQTLADLQGLKIRTAGAWLEIARELGAAPLTSAGGEVYPMLDRKVIDATEWGTLYENVSPGFHRITRYIIIPGAHQPTAPFELLINQRAWEKLSIHDQRLIDVAAKLVTFESWTRLGQEDIKAYHFFQAEGNQIVQLTPQAQHKIKQLGLKWARSQARENAWFKKVLEHQIAFETSWQDAPAFRNPVQQTP